MTDVTTVIGLTSGDKFDVHHPIQEVHDVLREASRSASWETATFTEASGVRVDVVPAAVAYLLAAGGDHAAAS